MKYEEIIKLTNEPELILRYLFQEVDDNVFNRIKIMISRSNFLSNFINKLYVFEKPQLDTDIPIDDKCRKEKMVSLNEYDQIYDGFVPYHPQIFVLPDSYMNQLKGSLPEIYLRESIVKSILNHLSLLPEGYCFKIYDGYRTYECQKELYDQVFKEKYDAQLDIDEFKKSYQEIKKNVKNNIMTYCVDSPSYDPPNPHLTGGCVNIRICSTNQIDINYGCSYNDFSETSKTNFYEEKLEKGHPLDDYELEALLNRRVTINILNYQIDPSIDNKLYNNFYFCASEETNGVNRSNKFYGSCEKDNIKLDPNYTIMDCTKDSK